jgi:tetratricopeptide (TPR) repeat protein
MISEGGEDARRKFATRMLPWLGGAGGLALYLFTLSHWVSLPNLGLVARISGWSWQPELGQPLTAALLYLFHFLPEAWIPLALNLFTAVCAALVLTLLARSVALLPHDLTRDQPFREDQPITILSAPTAWMPPVLAVLLCALQLSFWEQATSASGEMIDLLVFAGVVWCLFEFRINQQQRWLSAGAVLYTAGMANNGVMIVFFPLFVAAVLRIKGFKTIFDGRFLRRMGLWGLAGLSLYLLLPALQALSSAGVVHFWTALGLHLESQKSTLAALRTSGFKALAFTSLLSLLVLSIRWKSHTVQSSDDSRLGVFLTKSTVHFVHGLCLAGSLWLALDPTFSPRHLSLGTPLLAFYYLAALVFGYCAGYFLLFGSNARELAADGSMAGFLAARRAILQGKLAVAVAWALIGGLPLVLVWKNLPHIRLTNGPALREFARQLYADLPAGNSVVLSEETRQLLLLRAELSAHGQEKAPLLLDSPSLFTAQYHVVMAKRFPARWPVAPPTNRVAPLGAAYVENLVSRFAAREPVVYLHPSSGLFFERSTDQPHGSIHFLLPRAAQSAPAPEQPPDDRVMVQNEQLWQQRWTNGLQALAEHTRERPQYGPPWAYALRKRLRLAVEQDPTAAFLGTAYAKSLDYCGVQAQRLGRWSEAGVWFQRALELNPRNLSAAINLAYNERCRQGDRKPLDRAFAQDQFPELFSKYRNWAEILNANGPVDEPTYLLEVAHMFREGKNDYQAARDFARCVELAPDWPEPKLWLALSYMDLQDFARALAWTDRLQASSPLLDTTGRSQLLLCRATALKGLGRTNDAAACIASFANQYREQSEVLSGAVSLFEQNLQFEDELILLDELTRNEPANVKLLARKGFAELQLSKCDAAIATLTTVLSATPSDEEARLHRAMAGLGAGHLDAARGDYEKLLKSRAHSQHALFGLGGIAWRQQDTNAAVRLYEEFLSNVSEDSPQYRLAIQRLTQLKGREL